MKKENPLILLLMAALVFGAALVVFPAASFAQAEKDRKEARHEADDDDDDEELTDADRQQVKLTIEAARKIALDRVPGTVVDEELEKENGRLQYAFDIRDADGKLFDVEINAVTGEVIQAEEDDDDDDASAKSKAKEKFAKSRKAASKTAKLVKPKTE